MAPSYASIASALLVPLALLLTTANGQCINNVAAYHPNIRTMTSNGTLMIVPVPKDAVQNAVNEAFPTQNYTLLPVPTSDKSLFPNGFPAGAHPVLAQISYSDDIRMTLLQIDGVLRNAVMFAPFVGTQNSSTPLLATLSQYIAGPNGESVAGVVPALVSTVVEGSPLRLGAFQPAGAAYSIDNGGTFSSEAKWEIIPNPVTGPGVFPEVADFLFHQISEASSKYTDNTFKALINQPVILSTGQCQRNTYYFTNATALPFFSNGQVTFGPGADGSGLLSSDLQSAAAGGVFADVDGFSACAQVVGNNPEDCETAAKNVDPVSLQ